MSTIPRPLLALLRTFSDRSRKDLEALARTTASSRTRRGDGAATTASSRDPPAARGAEPRPRAAVDARHPDQIANRRRFDDVLAPGVAARGPRRALRCRSSTATSTSSRATTTPTATRRATSAWCGWPGAGRSRSPPGRPRGALRRRGVHRAPRGHGPRGLGDPRGAHARQHRGAPDRPSLVFGLGAFLTASFGLASLVPRPGLEARGPHRAGRPRALRGQAEGPQPRGERARPGPRQALVPAEEAQADHEAQPAPEREDEEPRRTARPGSRLRG